MGYIKDGQYFDGFDAAVITTSTGDETPYTSGIIYKLLEEFPHSGPEFFDLSQKKKFENPYIEDCDVFMFDEKTQKYKHAYYDFLNGQFVILDRECKNKKDDKDINLENFIKVKPTKIYKYWGDDAGGFNDLSALLELFVQERFFDFRVVVVGEITGDTRQRFFPVTLYNKE